MWRIFAIAQRTRKITGTHAGNRIAGTSFGSIRQYRRGDFTSCSESKYGMNSTASLFSNALTGSCFGKSVTEGNGIIGLFRISLYLFAKYTE